ANDNRKCYRPGYLCVNHPRCQSTPLCYSVDIALQILCPAILPTTTPPPVMPIDDICANATWHQNGIIVAGGNGDGSALNQLNGLEELFVDDNSAIYVADFWNSRVIIFEPTVSSDRVVAGGNEAGSQD
ncbi:unnamed protein product, partial [Rotaria magnacalcarata]